MKELTQGMYIKNAQLTILKSQVKHKSFSRERSTIYIVFSP